MTVTLTEVIKLVVTDRNQFQIREKKIKQHILQLLYCQGFDAMNKISDVSIKPHLQVQSFHFRRWRKLRQRLMRRMNLKVRIKKINII